MTREKIRENIQQSFLHLILLEDLAAIFKISPQTLRNWVALRKIPSIKIGRRRFFQQKSLEKWLDQKEESIWL